MSKESVTNCKTADCLDCRFLPKPFSWILLAVLPVLPGLASAHASLDSYEYVGGISGSSGYKNGSEGVASIKEASSGKTVTVRVKGLIPGTGYVVNKIEDGKVLVRDRSGRSYAIGRNPFPKEGGGASSSGGNASIYQPDGSAESFDEGETWAQQPDGEGTQLSQASANVYSPADAASPYSQYGNVARIEGSPSTTAHYSIPQGEEGDFIRARQEAEDAARLAEQAASGMGEEESSDTVGADLQPDMGVIDQAPATAGMPDSLSERARRRADNAGFYDRIRRYRSGDNSFNYNSGVRRPPTGMN